MSLHRRRYSKREPLGSLHVDCVMSVSNLGLVPGTNRWEVLRAFLNRGEGRAKRLVEAREGFLILQSSPGRPNTGAIYVYRESLGAFFWLSFGEHEDDLSGEDFQNALRIHRLIRFVEDAKSCADADAGDMLHAGFLLPGSQFSVGWSPRPLHLAAAKGNGLNPLIEGPDAQAAEVKS